MDALIAELEAATEGSRDTDTQIACLLGHELHSEGPWMKSLNPMEPDYPAIIPVPFYTTSLDAVLTLVPEGWVWYVQIDYELPGRASLYKLVPGGKDDPPVHVQADGATPALAFCIAALRARQAMEEDG